MRRLSVAVVAVAVLAAFVPPSSAEWAVKNQRVEYMQSPAMGIDVPSPRFAWVLDSSSSSDPSQRGVYQDSYQIVVTEADTGVTAWDSGRVHSPENRHVPYGSTTASHAKPSGRSMVSTSNLRSAAALKSVTAYDWTVTVWLGQDKQTIGNVTSASSRFVTSFLDASGWQDSDWLTGDTRADSLFRHEFSLKSEPKRALLLVAGLGYFKATINGAAVSDAVLESGWTDWQKRVLYSTYDVTHLIATGGQPNVLGISLGNGWFGSIGGGEPDPNVSRVFRAKLVVDGRSLVTTTGDAWACHPGPIVYDSIYNGEVYDARVEPQVEGWDKPGFDASGWSPSVPVRGPAGKLVSPKMPPARKIKVMKPRTMHMPQPGVYVFDFGQNFAGRVALTIPTNQMRKGANVTLRHAEVLQHVGIVERPQSGMLYVDNLRSARATDTYIFGGQSLRPSRRRNHHKGESVVYEPTFTYHGFRYVEVTGIQPTIDSLTGYLIHTDVSLIGSIEFSDSLMNSIQSAVHWGQRCNILSLPTDCPQRDERKGWLGDAQLSGEESQFNFDMVATHIKFLHDIVDEQNSRGELTDTAPLTFGSQPADPSWGSAFPSLVYYLWRETGDKRIVSDFYEALSLYINSLLVAVQSTGIGNMFYHYGDWCFVPGTAKCSEHLTAAFSLLENLRQMQVLARAIGHDQDAAIFASYASTLTTAFHEVFYVNNTYSTGGQTCLSLPLWIGATPDQSVSGRVSRSLLRDLIEEQDFHFTTGIIGLKYMLEVLGSLGRLDVAVTTLQQRTYPSFGFMLTNEYEPATTVWELWNAHVEGPGMNSRNHIMFGGPVGSFFYKYLGGIQAIDTNNRTAGYREFVLSVPVNPCMALESTATAFLSPMGPIKHDWHQVSGGLQVHVEVPVGSVAQVVFDGKALASNVAVSLEGKDVHQHPGVQVTDLSNGVVVTLVSGAWDLDATYSFDAEVDCRSSALFQRAAK